MGIKIKKNDKNYLLAAILMLVGSLCFGIVTYGHFYENEYMMGILCLVATLCDFMSFIINIIKCRKNK